MSEILPNPVPEVPQDEPYNAAREQYERLHATTDVTVWAHEWVATAALMVAQSNGDPLVLLDEGWMIGWFANYAQAVNDQLHIDRARAAVEAAIGDAIDAADQT
jgi:hypothetical protein